MAPIVNKEDKNTRKRKLDNISHSQQPRVEEEVQGHLGLSEEQEQTKNNMFFKLPNNIRIDVRNGIRYLSPYWYAYRGFAKKRWIGRQIGEVFNCEFIRYHPHYSKAAIRKGRLFINGLQITDPEYRIRNNDLFVHISHRHETEIPALPIQFIEENDNFLVINKPPGLPVHPCGHYNLHSITSILKREYGRDDSDKLRPLYRLDRNTTGLLMFAKNKEADIKFKKDVRERKLRKEYIVKVEGIFPEGEVVCNEPISVLSPTIRVRCIRPDGQDSLSRFRRISADPVEGTSVLVCQIETGRTHQIRVHLQYLGFPVLNDYIYNDTAWGPAKGKGGDYGGKTVEQLIEDVGDRHDKKLWLLSSDQGYAQRLQEIGDNDMYEAEDFDLRKLDFDQMPDYDPICWNCAITEKREMTEKDWLMTLHCWRYSGDGWAFETQLPDWATKHSNCTQQVENTAIAIGIGRRQ